ncbi:MAG: hypothetical protein U0520_05060 [Candidatus Saccharimonadales bacterium]
MKLYRFSPIQDQAELFEAIKYIHIACHKLCKQSFNSYLPVAGNIGVFCHYPEEFDRLVKIRKSLTKPSENPAEKYFELYNPIIVQATDSIPEATYTHLYIRRSDIYRSQVGDLDFNLGEQEYEELKASLRDGKEIPGARIFPEERLDMVELFDPNVDVLAYVNTKKW